MVNVEHTAQKPAKKPVNWHKVRQKIWADRFMYLMITPVVAYYFIFRYIPMAWLRVAFYNFRILVGLAGSEFVGWANFQLFFNHPQFGQILFNTIWLNVLNLIFVFPAPIIFAILLNEISKSKFKRVVQTISYLPHFLSTVVVVSMITTLLSPSIGVIASITRSFGGTPVNFLGLAEWFRTIMVSTSIWQGVGWGSIIYLSALSGIDQEQYEAAIIDGASRFKQIRHITLPGISSTIIVLLILQVGALLTVGVERVYLLQNPLNLATSEVLSTYTFRLMMVQRNFGLATAVGLFNGVVSLFLVLFANRMSKRYSDGLM